MGDRAPSKSGDQTIYWVFDANTIECLHCRRLTDVIIPHITIFYFGYTDQIVIFSGLTLSHVCAKICRSHTRATSDLRLVPPANFSQRSERPGNARTDVGEASSFARDGR